MRDARLEAGHLARRQRSAAQARGFALLVHDKALRREVGQRQRGLARQRVAARQGGDKAVALQQRQRGIARRQQRRAHQAHVQRLVFQPLHDAGRGRFAQHQFDAGVFIAEARHQPWQQVRGRGADKTHPQGAGHAAAGRLHQLAELAGMEQDAPGLGEHGAAGLGQRDAARLAHEQGGVEFRLELLDRDRQRGLGDMQAFCRAAEIEGLGQHDEVPDAAQFHEVNGGAGATS
ncbi:hypothetical protein D3C81_1494220 [compost metagenome]